MLTEEEEKAIFDKIAERSQEHVRQLRDAYIKLKQLASDRDLELSTLKYEYGELQKELQRRVEAAKVEGQAEMRLAFVGMFARAGKATMDRLHIMLAQSVEDTIKMLEER